LSIIADCSTREKTWSRAWPAYGPKVLRPDGALWHDEHMQNWNRPDPLTRDLIHLINARRHDHWDADAAFDTLAELIEQNREDEILTVLAALDEDMAEWLFDLLAEAASTNVESDAEMTDSAVSILTLALPLQANFGQPLKLTLDPEETAALLRQHLRLSQTAQIAVDAKLLTDSTLDRISLQALHAHVASVFRPERWPPLAPRLHMPVEHTVYLLFGIRDEAEPAIPEEMADADKEALL